jgi:hypothetical protein
MFVNHTPVIHRLRATYPQHINRESGNITALPQRKAVIR